jgi:hypothetical protein
VPFYLRQNGRRYLGSNNHRTQVQPQNWQLQLQLLSSVKLNRRFFDKVVLIVLDLLLEVVREIFDLLLNVGIELLSLLQAHDFIGSLISLPVIHGAIYLLLPLILDHLLF